MFTTEYCILKSKFQLIIVLLNQFSFTIYRYKGLRLWLKSNLHVQDVRQLERELKVNLFNC